MKREMILNLLGLLKTEMNIYSELKEALIHQKAAIINNDLDILEMTCKQISVLTSQVSQLERRRFEMARAIQEELKIKPKELVLNNIVDHLDESTKGEFDEVGQKLAEILFEINNINQGNMRMLRKSMDFVDKSIKYISGCENTNSYSNIGKSRQTKYGMGNVLNSKA